MKQAFGLAFFGLSLETMRFKKMSDNWNTLKRQIEYFSKPFPADAIAFAGVHKEELAPYLRSVLADVARSPEIAADGNYMLHMYAMHLLATWRDVNAYAAMVAIGSHSDDVLDDILGDTVTETYGRCLASVCDGNVESIQALIENADVSVWARTAGLDALETMVFEGDYPRESLIQYLQKLGASESVRLKQLTEKNNSYELIYSIVSAASKLSAVDMQDQMMQWFDDDLIDKQVNNKAWVNRQLAIPFETHRVRELSNRRGYVNSVANEISWWSSFHEKESLVELIPPPFMREGKKIGRNDPCTCGSGKKYKKCHGA
jgi:Protein of unknown function (DUF1186)/SEC-C motif